MEIGLKKNRQVENRMERLLGDNHQQGRHSLVLYFPLGDTILDSHETWARRYFENGADVLEMGLPYEDPALDGPSVQNSMRRALMATDLDHVFTAIKNLRREFPDRILQIMTYFGNVRKYGIERFSEICHECDVDGVLSPDASLEDLRRMDKALLKYNIINLRFAPYILTDEIIIDLKENSRGYIFLQAVNGSTGPRKTVDLQVRSNIDRIRAAGVRTLIFAGFGISNTQQAAEVISMGADGIIVGSTIINHIIDGSCAEYIQGLSRVM